jgi:hypothetical protein
MAQLPTIVSEELENYGLEEESDAVTALVKGLLFSLNYPSKEGCTDLISWVWKDALKQSKSFDLLVRTSVSKAEFEAMKERKMAGTQRLLTTENAGNSHSCVSEAYSFELLTLILGGQIELEKTETEV